MEKLKVCMNPSLPTSYTEALSYLEDLGRLRYELDQVIKAVNAGQTFYILPIATDTTLGGVKAISKTDESRKVAIDADGQIWSAYPVIADDQTTGLVKGTVKTDEDAMVAVDENGELWYKTNEIATDKVAGIVRAAIKDTQSHKVAIDAEGQLYSDYPEVATANDLGLVKGPSRTANQTTPVGIAADGRMYVDTSIDVPVATATEIGGVKANAATSDYTGEVRIDSNGKLKVKEYALPDNIGKAVNKTTQNHAVGIGADGQLYSDYPSIATNDVAGLVKAKAKTDESVEVAVDATGKLYVPANAGIAVASDAEIGGIKAKARTDEDRKVAIGTDGYAYYKVPQASALEVGGIKAEPRSTETNEVKIDTTTGKLYAGQGGITEVPKASSNTLGGILADPAGGIDNIPIFIASDGHLFARNTARNDIASTVSTGGILVGEGGNDLGTPPTTQSAFYPDSTNYPLLSGTRVPFSVDTVDDGRYETYNTDLYLDLSETPADQITPTKLNDYISYADSHGYSLRIHASDGRDYYDSGKIVGKDRTFVTRPYPVSGILNVSVMTINTEGEYAYDIATSQIEPEVVLPAREDRYGTIKAAIRTSNETNEVKIDTSTGKLYAPASGGGTADTDEAIYTVTASSSVYPLEPEFWSSFLVPALNNNKRIVLKFFDADYNVRWFVADAYNKYKIASSTQKILFKSTLNIGTVGGDSKFSFMYFTIPIKAPTEQLTITPNIGAIVFDPV